MNYLDALRLIHQAVKPDFYVEIGCRLGSSLELAQCPRLAIDPEPEITSPLTWPTRIFRETSDGFFSRPDVASVLGQKPGMAFIDGMHLVEFALRDFMNLEAHSRKDTVIAIDDVVPGDIAWASRDRETQAWTGDVYRLIPLLRHYRPDLDITVFDAQILNFDKGLAVISNLDPQNTVLAEAYDTIISDLEDGAFLEASAQAVRDRLQVRPSAELKPHLDAITAKENSQSTATSAKTGQMRPFNTPFPKDVLMPMQEGVMQYTYKGVRCLKCPLDMAIYMKLLWDLKPKTIIEIGSKFGGSALFFADMAEAFGLDTHVYSIDLEPPSIDDPRITFLQGNVLHLEKTFAEHGLSDCPRPWYVNEDSAHTFDACTAALKFLGKEMQPGDMLAMEDGNLVELGLSEKYDGGPNRAIAGFFESSPDVFEVVTELCDMFGKNATYNPNGYLRKT